MAKIHLWPEEAIEQKDIVSTGVTLEEVNGERKSIWYRLPSEFAPAITQWCDPYVLAVLFKAMITPADLVVHGKVSPSLLFNLKEFQAAWHSWRPDRYSEIKIIPEKEEERPKPIHKNAVVAFSGGADSCYTAWHYTNPKDERLPHTLQAGLFIHGFDFPPNLRDTFDRAFRKAQILLDSLGMTLIPMTTNLRSIRQPPVDAGGAFLASCLMLLQERYVAGLIASTYSYAHLFLPFGSNPLTDRMMSSGAFNIHHDGAKVTRIQKLKAISEWPEAMQYLRVCTGRKAAERDKNCCRCEKCIRNILEFRAMGFGLPRFFENDVIDWQIFKLKYEYETEVGFHYEDIISFVKARKVSASWVRVLKFSIFLNKIRIKAERIPWINRFLHGVKRRITTIRRRFKKLSLPD